MSEFAARLMASRAAVALATQRRASADAAPLLILIALLAFAALFTPFVFRAADDNRLTSWQWIFAGLPLASFSALVACGIAAAFVLRKLELPPRGASILLFGLSFAAAVPFWSAPESIVDAARYFTQAKYLELYGAGALAAAWGKELSAWTDLPLVPFLYGLIFRYAGEERVYIQILTTAMFAGTAVLTYRIGREWWDETVGFYAAALLLAMPYLLTQVPLMLVDVPAMFLLAASLFAAINAFRHGGAGRCAAAAAAITLAALAKYSLWPILIVLIGIALLCAREKPRAVAVRASAILGAAAAILGLFIFAGHEVVLVQLRLLWDYQRPGLDRWRESFVSTFFFQMHPFIILAATYALCAAIRRKDARLAIVGALLAAALLAGVARSRYLLVLFPLFALAAAYGMREIRNTEARAFALGCAVIPSLAIAFFAYVPFLQSVTAANLQRAGTKLDALDVTRVEVITLEQPGIGIHPAVAVPLLDLATRKPLAYRPPALEPPPDASASSLRFTWEYSLPRYYLESGAEPARRTAVALILREPTQALPQSVVRRLAQHCLTNEFMTSERVFGYQTLVRIFEPAANPTEACPQGGIE